MASNIKVDIVKPTATNGSLSLKGDSGGSATANGITVNSSGNTSITGTTTISSADINGGTIDGATIATSNITIGAGKTLNVSAGTLTLANDQISGDKINGGTISNFASTGIDDNATSGPALTIAASGDVGIGTSTPVYQLQVNDGAVTNGTTGSLAIYGGQTNQAEGSVISQIFFKGRTDAGSAGTKIATIKGSSNQQDSLVFYTGTTSLSERMRIDSSGNLKFDSGYGSAATAYGCRAWVNFNGTFGTSPFTIANGGIRASGNVSSITDNGTGYYTVNFTTAMPDANYSVLHWGMFEGSLNANGVIPGGRVPATTFSTTYTKVYYVTSTTAAATDATYACVAVLR